MSYSAIYIIYKGVKIGRGIGRFHDGVNVATTFIVLPRIGENIKESVQDFNYNKKKGYKITDYVFEVENIVHDYTVKGGSQILLHCSCVSENVRWYKP